jgi:hypothetical protein
LRPTKIQKVRSEFYQGIIAVSSDPKINVIAFPDKTKGYVTVKKYENYMNISTNTISCHDSNIFNLALNSDGTILATTSDKVKYHLNRELL